MDDKELLIAAAKAAGIEIEFYEAHGREICKKQNYFGPDKWWNPLTDDGDALRLAVTLGMKVLPYPQYSPEKHSVEVTRLIPAPPEDDDNTFIGPQVVEVYKCNKYAATRRAVVRAAASLGSQI